MLQEFLIVIAIPAAVAATVVLAFLFDRLREEKP